MQAGRGRQAGAPITFTVLCCSTFLPVLHDLRGWNPAGRSNHEAHEDHEDRNRTGWGSAGPVQRIAFTVPAAWPFFESFVTFVVGPAGVLPGAWRLEPGA
jgi:hypothetical protein